LIRALRTGLRTAHLLAFAALYGGHVYGVAAGDLDGAWVATLATGAALMGVDLVREPVFLVQLRGTATLVKIALLVAVQAAPSAALPLLTVAAVIGAVASHMPGRYRYWSLAHGRIVGSRDKG
jgi:hypothetical protein